MFFTQDSHSAESLLWMGVLNAFVTIILTSHKFNWTLECFKKSGSYQTIILGDNSPLFLW